MPEQPRRNVEAQPQLRAVVIFLLIASTGEFLVRGPLRIAQSPHWNDFVSPYVQAGAWIHGQDPYNPENLARFWPSGTHMPEFVLHQSADNTIVEHHGIPSPYPPTTFVILAPLAILPWKIALVLWITISVAAAAAMPFVLSGISAIRLSSTLGLFFLTLCLGLAPIHTGLATGNLSVVGVGLSVVSLWFSQKHCARIAAVFVAASICLKPPIGLCFLFFYLFSRRWRLVATVCGVAALFAIVAVGRMSLAGVPWLANYRMITQHMFAAGAINDFSPLNPVWFQLVNLQGGLAMIIGNPGAARIAALVIGGFLVILWASLCQRSGARGNELLDISALALLSLLPVYHRFYDASLLVLPLAWALSPRTRASSCIRVLAITLITPFLVPGAAILEAISMRLSEHSILLEGRLWNGLVVAHEIWALLLLSILLLHAMKTLCKLPAPVSHPNAAQR